MEARRAPSGQPRLGEGNDVSERWPPPPKGTGIAVVIMVSVWVASLLAIVHLSGVFMP